MNNVLIGLGVLIVAVLSALFAIPHFVDWNSYRGVIEEEASRVIGRDVRIGGDIKLQLLPAPSFVIEKLRVADAAARSGEPLFRADRIDARLSIVPLVRGVLEANEIELVKPVLRLVLDDNGRGNWRTLAAGRIALPFLPNDVALQSVKITGGTLSVFDRDGTPERLTLTPLAGELSAPALEGPYRFRGTFGSADQQRELRLTTLPADADGLLQIKASLKDFKTTASATLDGRLRDLFGTPSLTGELTALLPMPAAPPGAGSAAAPPAELKATVDATAKRMSLQKLSIAFESPGENAARPQVLSGQAEFNWDGAVVTTAALSAPWIDLDHVLGNPTGGNPLLALADFGQRINALLISNGQTKAVLEFDQANLGHDVAGNIRMELKSSAGLLAVEQLRVNLPGGTGVEVQGRITGEGAATTFQGDMHLHGTSLARLAGWASGGGIVIEPAHDRPFSVHGSLAAEPERGSVRNIRAEFGDSTLEGDMEFVWTGRRKLRVVLEGPRIDARSVLPAKLTLQGLAEVLASRQSGDASAAAAAGSDNTGFDLSLDLKAAELSANGQVLHDVVAIVESGAQGTTIERLQFSADHGVALALEGRLGRPAADTKVATPGLPIAIKLRGSIAAGDGDGLNLLASMLDIPQSALGSPDLMAELVPLRLAGTVTRGAAPTLHNFDIAADGQFGQTSAKIKLVLANGFDTWRSAAADLDLVLFAKPNANLPARALALLGAAQRMPRAEPDPTDTSLKSNPSGGPASMSRLAVRAVGIPASGLSLAIRSDNPDATMLVNGRGRVTETATLEVAGDVTLDARDARGVLDAALGRHLLLGDPLVLKGTAVLDARAGAATLSDIALTGAEGEKISGRMAITQAIGTTKQRRVEGELVASALDVRALLSTVLQRTATETDAAIKVTSGRAGSWPERSFDFSRLRDFDVALKFKSDRLTLAPGVAMQSATFAVTAGPEAIELRDIAGETLGGAAAATARLERTPAGAALTTRINLVNSQLANFGATGTGDTAVTLTGRGLSPAGLVSNLSGKGTVQLGAAEIRDLTPATVQTAVETALKAPPEALADTLKTALAADAARAPLPIGPRALAITVQDGVARLQPLAVVNPDGRATLEAALDLATFGISGAWRVETKLPPLPQLPGTTQPASAGVALPAVVQRFGLSAAALDTARAGQRVPVDTEALERELVVRKVERDLAELERLRRLDEERAAQQKREKDAQAAGAAPADWANRTDAKPAPAAAQ